MTRSSKDHCEIVLAAIIPDGLDLLDKVNKKLTPSHFSDTTCRVIFGLIDRYLDVTGAILTRDGLSDLLGSQDAGKRALLEEYYDYLLEKPASESDFNWSVEQLRELHAERAVGEALSESMAILVQGVEAKGGEVIKGQTAARQHLLDRLSVIDRELHVEEAPEGDIREEYKEMMDDYEERKRLRAAGLSDGIMFGIPDLDNKTGGLQNGELDLLIGYTSCGKTKSATVQLSWHAHIMQGKNVVIATTETGREQVRRKLIARHSKLPQFGLEKGLNSRDIKNGALTSKEEKILQEVIWDYTHNPDYGKCNIIQVPKGSTVLSVEQRFHRLQREFHIDLGVMDYIALFTAGRKRQTTREELAALILETKQMATSFDGGRGLPIVSPWQVSRAAWDMAQKTQAYTLSALAETAEAERSADIVISLLEPLSNTSRNAKIMAQVLKNRDGETGDGIVLAVDYATSFFEAFSDSTALAGLLD